MRDPSILFLEDDSYSLRPGYGCEKCEPRRFPADGESILAALRPLERDSALVSQARAILAAFDRRVYWLEDENAFEQLSHLIRIGALHVCRVEEEKRARLGNQPPAAAPAPAPSPQSSGPQAAPPPPPTFPPDHSPAAQASALQNAAAAGVPFCEICQDAAGSAA